MGAIRIATLKVNGVRDQVKGAGLYEVLRQKVFDVALLQEIHSDTALDSQSTNIRVEVSQSCYLKVLFQYLMKWSR